MTRLALRDGLWHSDCDYATEAQFEASRILRDYRSDPPVATGLMSTNQSFLVSLHYAELIMRGNANISFIAGSQATQNPRQQNNPR